MSISTPTTTPTPTTTASTTTPSTTSSTTPAAGSRAAAPTDKLISIFQKQGGFTQLLAAINAAGLTETLQGPGPYTVFAPNDAAFAKVDKTALADLLKPENKGKLAAILKLHVVSGHVNATATGDKPSTLKSLQGEDLVLDASSGLKVNKAGVVKKDIEAANGVIHAIDTVLMPH